MQHWVLIIGISYLVGSLPIAYLVARAHGINIFDVGSGNMGATNVWRALGIGWALLVWVLDISKGVVAILIARQIDPSPGATVLAAIMSIVGHNWSLFVIPITRRLRGGKGAAITLGTLLVIAPQVVAVITLIGGLVLIVTRYMSLTVLVMYGIAMAWIIALVAGGQMPNEYALYSFSAAALLIYRFRENITRLLSGTERRVGERV